VRKYESLAHAVKSNDQEGSFDAEAFATGVAEHLKRGHFRLVFVLDEAPEELIRLVNYLETVSDQLVIDVITLSSYAVNGSQILVPQRVEAERQHVEPLLSPSPQPKGESEGLFVDGAEDFIAGMTMVSEPSRTFLQRLSNWAIALEQAHLVKLGTYHGMRGILTLLPRLPADNAGMVSIYNNKGSAYVQLWRSVFERRAPKSLARIELMTPVKQGNTIREVSDDLLDALTAAYQEAGRGVIEV
jgi:hypothetical protein